MEGHWWFGLGWGRREFKDGSFAFLLNRPSNAPLLTTYRGGLIAGIAFVIVLVVGMVIAYRLLRSNRASWAFAGGVFIGFCVVSLQLDHPVVGIPQATLDFSLMLAFLVYVDRQRTEALHKESLRHTGAPDTKKALAAS
jgi:hypothetical protein